MRKSFIRILFISFIALLPQLLFAQPQTVTGKIADAKGQPLAGASITVKQSNRGTVTDADGKFSLVVPPNTYLVISSAGFKTQTIKADAANLLITLEEDIARLDEVVVTGLSTTVKRRNLANAVAIISSKELSGTAPAQTFDAALEGKISGAYINANSGAPGGGISVKLRGA